MPGSGPRLHLHPYIPCTHCLEHPIATHPMSAHGVVWGHRAVEGLDGTHLPSSHGEQPLPPARKRLF